jgi:hypothetical protein
LVATVLIVALTAGCEVEERQTGSGLVPVVGHWTDTTAGGAASVVNGERWSGTTSPEDLQRRGERLFGSATPEFLANGTAAGAFPHAVMEDAGDVGSGTLRVEFNLSGGASDQIAGILFGLGPRGEYHYVRYNTKDGNVAVWKFANGERQVLHHGEVHKQIPLGTWHELVVEIRGAQVRGYIAGDTTISVEHTLDAEPAGRVGVWAKRDAVTGFRSFTVQR